MPTTIGQQLRLAREERGIALREISDQTRISMRYLEAIETNDYQRLPGGIFNRSFVKAYARCVGFDEKEAVEAYVKLMRDQGQVADNPEITPYHSKVYTDSATRSPLLTVIIAILILAILTLGALGAQYWYHWYQRRSALSQTHQRTERLVSEDRASMTVVSAGIAAGLDPLRRDNEDFLDQISF